MSTAADLLIEARGRAALSQAELARRAGIPRSVLNAYERGRRQPGAEALAQVLEAAGFVLGLVPKAGVDPDRAGRILADVLDLAEALPYRPARNLACPPLVRRVS